MTPTEARLWRLLRSRRFEGYKFRRQHPIGRFIADFCCLEKRLVVECDGSSHDTKQEYDAERDAFLAAWDYIVVHFTNDEIEKDPAGVLQRIFAFLEERP